MKHNFDCRKKIIYRFICKHDDPRVYEPVCYKMLVGKEYYAMQCNVMLFVVFC